MSCHSLHSKYTVPKLELLRCCGSERAELIAVAQSEPSQWTLVVVMGQARTIEYTVDHLVANLLLPNQPCHLSLALDPSPWWYQNGSGWAKEPKWKLPAYARAVLHPWLVSERSLRPACKPGKLCAHIEFRLALQALEGGLKHGQRVGTSYRWIVAVRTDNDRQSVSRRCMAMRPPSDSAPSSAG